MDTRILSLPPAFQTQNATPHRRSPVHACWLAIGKRPIAPDRVFCTESHPRMLGSRCAWSFLSIIASTFLIGINE
jgi:hypothetical protein